MSASSAQLQELVYCYPIPTDNVGVSYIALSLYKEMHAQGHSVAFLTPVIRRDAFGIGVRQVVPLLFRLLPWKRLSRVSRPYYRRAVLDVARPGTALHFWSDQDPALLKAAKEQGAIIVKEKFNCAQRVAREILSSEYRRCSLPDRCRVTEHSIRSEEEQLRIADYIVSQSPMVHDSLVTVGVDPSKIIDSSYGWRPLDTKRTIHLRESEGRKRPFFLCVGTVEIRKGSHLLLQHWRKAATSGTLFFLGAIRDEMKGILQAMGPSPDVVFLGHHEKAHHLYEEADAFLLASLEEGSPLVTYEAMGHGLPVIVSPMAAGPVARDRVDGFVVDSQDEEGWVHALRALASDVGLREELSRSARARAEAFQWAAVAKSRYSALQQRLAVS